ncbi:hypothetical protein BH24CHL4_BH24CHL4_21300 [soil metagenome]
MVELASHHPGRREPHRPHRPSWGSTEYEFFDTAGGILNPPWPVSSSVDVTAMPLGYDYEALADNAWFEANCASFRPIPSPAPETAPGTPCGGARPGQHCAARRHRDRSEGASGGARHPRASRVRKYTGGAVGRVACAHARRPSGPGRASSLGRGPNPRSAPSTRRSTLSRWATTPISSMARRFSSIPTWQPLWQRRRRCRSPSREKRCSSIWMS